MSRTAARKAAPDSGLALVKHVLNRHGGRLAIESTLGAGREPSRCTLPLRTGAAAGGAINVSLINDLDCHLSCHKTVIER